MAGNRRPAGKAALQVWIEEETHFKFKMLCTMKKIKMTDVTAGLVEEWVKQELKTNLVLEKFVSENKGD
ncbi:hypothetical protein QUR06_000245 [Escherichia coli]|nr:hypothetical protein [Escherichia coli]